MHKLVHAWGQDRLEADGQQQLSSLVLELMADTTAEDQIDPSHQLRLVPHVMASFGMFSPSPESLDELAMGRLAIIGGIEGFLFRIGGWSEAYRMRCIDKRWRYTRRCWARRAKDEETGGSSIFPVCSVFCVCTLNVSGNRLRRDRS